MKPKPSIWRKGFQITTGFEGKVGGYDNITGNFDGAGLSLGLLQWNFGTGTLQPLFKRLFNEFPQVAAACLPEGGYWLQRAIYEGWEMEWAKQIQVNNRVVDPWISALTALCNTPEFRLIQDEAEKVYKDIAVDMCLSWGLLTDRAYCLAYDIAVQNGGLQYYDMLETEYMDRLCSWVEVAVSGSDREWQANVRSRKEAILNGGGYVHGMQFEFQFSDSMAFFDENVPGLESIYSLYDAGELENINLWEKVLSQHATEEEKAIALVNLHFIFEKWLKATQCR